MKYILAIAATLLASPAMAQATSTSANVPTGYQVPGCANYRLVNGAVVPFCKDQRTSAEWVRGLVSPGDPAYTGSAGDSAAAAK